MLTDSTPVQVRAILPAPEGCAVFLGGEKADKKKVFVIYVDPAIGPVLTLALSPAKKDRPLTHDLMANIFKGLGVTLERMVINNAIGETFYARMILKMENELGVKMVEVDARPSDAIVLCLNIKKPIAVATALWNKLPDATALMNKLLGSKN